MKIQKQKSSKYGPLIFLGIIAIVLLLLFAIPFGIIYFKSKAKCGSGGMLNGNSKEGYSCAYTSVCENCQNASQCPDCTSLCESKGKIKRDCYLGEFKVDLTGKIKKDKEGNIYIERGPINCNCCCD
jgi:hypothetical protein